MLSFSRVLDDTAPGLLVRLVGGDIPAHVPDSTRRGCRGAPRRGAHPPPPAAEVARFYLATISAQDCSLKQTRPLTAQRRALR